MPKRTEVQRRPADMNQVTDAAVDIGIGETSYNPPERDRPGKLEGGKARFQELTAKRRPKIAHEVVAERRSDRP